MACFACTLVYCDACSHTVHACWLVYPMNATEMLEMLYMSNLMQITPLIDDVVSHLVLEVHLDPTGEENLYHISMSTATGHHEGIPVILRNKTVNHTSYEHELPDKGIACYSIHSMLDSAIWPQ